MFLCRDVIYRFWSAGGNHHSNAIRQARQSYYFSTHGCGAGSITWDFVCLVEVVLAVKKLEAMAV